MSGEVKISNRLLDDIVAVVFKNMDKISLFRKTPAKRKGTRNLVKKHVGAALKCGAFDYLYDKDQLIAYLFLTKAEFAPGLPVSMGVINGTGNKKSKDWLKKKLNELQFLFDSSTQFDLPFALKGMLPVLNDAGFNIETVKLMGSPKECLKKFDDDLDPYSFFESKNLSVNVASRKDLEAVRDIERREFKRNPQYGWFVANESWLDSVFKSRLHSLKNKDVNCYVLKSNRGKVKGYFGVYAHQTPNFGKLAGPELIFDKSLQGKGLSRAAYQILLKDMVRNKVEFLMGNTSQAGVLKHAKSMGRVPVSFFMRYHDGYFSKDHFFKHF